MRGVLHATLEVSSGISDAHSGVDGGVVAEPMFDMVRVLGAIGGQDGVKLPRFCMFLSPSVLGELRFPASLIL